MSQPDAATSEGAGQTSVEPFDEQRARRILAALGFNEESYVQELGYAEDIDFQLRDDLDEILDQGLFIEEDDEVVDGVILWWREDDGDLVDGLVDALTNLDDGGYIWLLTPKRGQEGAVDPVDISQAAPTAGLHVTSKADVSAYWLANRLVPRRGN